jgi:hypothetical protein
MHALIKFAQMKDIFVCDMVASIEACQSGIYKMYCDQTSRFTTYNFWAFKSLLKFKYDNI